MADQHRHGDHEQHRGDGGGRRKRDRRRGESCDDDGAGDNEGDDG